MSPMILPPGPSGRMRVMARGGTGAFMISTPGLEEARRHIGELLRHYSPQEMHKPVRRAARVIERRIRKEAPRDTGQLAASIQTETEARPRELYAAIYSDLEHAVYMEIGTGIFAGRPPHWPPPSALHRWARRHGFESGFQVARIIGMRGGIEPRAYFALGVEKESGRFIRVLDRYVARGVRG